MTPRNRRDGQQTYSRLMSALEAGLGLIGERLDGMHSRMERLERDSAQGELDRQHLTNELAEIRRDMGAGRDQVSHLQKTMPETVAPAVAGAVTPAVSETIELGVAAAIKRLPRTWRGGVVILCVVLILFFEVADKGPKVLRLAEALWRAVKSMG